MKRGEISLALKR